MSNWWWFMNLFFQITKWCFLGFHLALSRVSSWFIMSFHICRGDTSEQIDLSFFSDQSLIPIDPIDTLASKTIHAMSSRRSTKCQRSLSHCGKTMGYTEYGDMQWIGYLLGIGDVYIYMDVGYEIYYIILYYLVLYYIILSCIILNYIIFYYIKLYYILLYN